MSKKSKVPKPKIPKLPSLLKDKIYKTGQTRGADDDAVFQNRVLRNNTVLVPLSQYMLLEKAGHDFSRFQKGYIVLIPPKEYFSGRFEKFLEDKKLILGENLLIFYQLREDWESLNPNDQKPPKKVANQRGKVLGGEYVARIPGNTSGAGAKIAKGYNEKPKGAGIRLFEYANEDTIENTRTQLECLFWHCYDSDEIAIEFGMSTADISTRRDFIFLKAKGDGVWDKDILISNRILDLEENTICPLCLEKISARGFFTKEAQAEGREVHNLTVTQLNLFHILELRVGSYEHRLYNLGWGHHHSNTVVKDAGIIPTLKWMKNVILRNEDAGHNFEKTEEETIELPQPLEF
ncbi:BstXI family restriction endonuclease [Deinococcus sp.]|uniref:BstXI family restriction endonuclease n=1 Tax=Deinococcus sp. TaxID=47478 RepID=UPI003B5CDD0F